jgi:Ca2+-binding EF-hand superfamily protein
MKYNKLNLVVTIFTLLLTVGVYAQGPPGGGGRGQGRGQERGKKPDASEILSKLDLNKDNVIDKEEASKDERGKIAEDFDEIDINDDEVIDLEELKASLDGKPKKVSAKKIIKQVDDNKDGTLNELEIAAKNQRDLIENFDKIDTNGDGELDLEELKVFYSNKDDKPKRRKKD